MARVTALLYGVVAYVLFLATFLYALGFVENLVVPKQIDSGSTGPVGTVVLINSFLLGLFAVQHSIMARPQFKAWWCRFVPRPIERSTFVLFASILLALMMWQWRAIPTPIWDIRQPVLRGLLQAISLGGWALVLYATFVIDHFDLFGLRQVWLYFRGVEYLHPPFIERAVYRYVRHPLMAGFLIAFWVTPTMTYGSLLFAVLTTGYIFVGILLEERDLCEILGEPYRAYRRRTPMLIPLTKSAPPSPERSA